MSAVWRYGIVGRLLGGAFWAIGLYDSINPDAPFRLPAGMPSWWLIVAGVALVDAFLKRRRSIPTLKYRGGSPFAVRAAAVTLKRFGSYLAIDRILADVGGISVLRHVKRDKVDDDVRRPLSDAEMASAINGASRLGGVPRAVCVLGFASGLRLNELREARVGDLDRYLRDRSTNRESDAPLFPTHTIEEFTEDGFAKLFQRIHHASGLRTFSAHLMRHTWATNFMRVPGASFLELKRQGRWRRWEQVERYSHAVPHHDRKTLPNPLQKTAFVQLPSARVSRLSRIG